MHSIRDRPFTFQYGERKSKAHAAALPLCCRYLLLLAAYVSRQLTTKRYRKCQGICFALQHNSDPRSSCDSVSRASARSRRAQSWWCATAGSSQGGAGHGKYLPTLRVQLCTLNKEEQFSPNHGGSRRLAHRDSARMRARRRVKLSTQTVASLDPLGRRTYHQQPRALHAQQSGWQTRT